MALHIKVRLVKNNTHLQVTGRFDDGTLLDSFTVPVSENETSAETVELAMMDREMVASWSWSCRFDSPVLEGEFVFAGSHKEVSDSKAHQFTLTN